MAKSSYLSRLRDGACAVAAFAMVLYVTLADHRPAEPDRIASATPGIVVGSSTFADLREGDRLVLAESGTAVP